MHYLLKLLAYARMHTLSGVPLGDSFYTGIDAFVPNALIPAYYKVSHPNGRDKLLIFCEVYLQIHSFLSPSLERGVAQEEIGKRNVQCKYVLE